jgi:hypothetical protein
MVPKKTKAEKAALRRAALEKKQAAKRAAAEEIAEPPGEVDGDDASKRGKSKKHGA